MSRKKQKTKIILVIVELLILVVLAVILYGVSKLNRIDRSEPNLMNQVEVNDDIMQGSPLSNSRELGTKG